MPVMHRRGPWTSHEDAHLLTLAQSHGPHNWVRISQLVGTRSPKQCRERFHQNLKPQLNHDPMTPEEGLLIERLVGEMGKRWAEIARRLHGRSDNAVKNWWNGGMNRRRRMCLRQKLASGGQENKTRDSEAILRYPIRNSRPRSRGQSIKKDVRKTANCSPSIISTSLSDFKDHTPSLISDSLSNQSVSPRLSLSPRPNSYVLPSLTSPSQYSLHHHQQYDFSNSRRSSMSIASIESSSTSMTPEISLSSRNLTIGKDSAAPISYFTLPPIEEPQYHYLRHSAIHSGELSFRQMLTPTSTRGHVDLYPTFPSSCSSSPDRRMHLASILV